MNPHLIKAVAVLLMSTLCVDPAAASAWGPNSTPTVASSLLPVGFFEHQALAGKSVGGFTYAQVLTPAIWLRHTGGELQLAAQGASSHRWILGAIVIMMAAAFSIEVTPQWNLNRLNRKISKVEIKWKQVLERAAELEDLAQRMIITQERILRMLSQGRSSRMDVERYVQDKQLLENGIKTLKQNIPLIQEIELFEKRLWALGKLRARYQAQVKGQMTSAASPDDSKKYRSSIGAVCHLFAALFSDPRASGVDPDESLAPKTSLFVIAGFWFAICGSDVSMLAMILTLATAAGILSVVLPRDWREQFRAAIFSVKKEGFKGDTVSDDTLDRLAARVKEGDLTAEDVRQALGGANQFGHSGKASDEIARKLRKLSREAVTRTDPAATMPAAGIQDALARQQLRARIRDAFFQVYPKDCSAVEAMGHAIPLLAVLAQAPGLESAETFASADDKATYNRVRQKMMEFIKAAEKSRNASWLKDLGLYAAYLTFNSVHVEHPFRKNPLKEKGVRVVVDLLSGYNFSQFLPFLDPDTHYIAIDQSIFVVTFLRELARLHHTNNLTVMQADARTLKPPVQPWAMIRAKNTGACIPGFGPMLLIMTEWLAPGGQLVLEADSRSLVEWLVVLKDHQNLFFELGRKGWSISYEKASSTIYHAFVLTKPLAGAPTPGRELNDRNFAAILHAFHDQYEDYSTNPDRWRGTKYESTIASFIEHYRDTMAQEFETYGLEGFQTHISTVLLAVGVVVGMMPLVLIGGTILAMPLIRQLVNRMRQTSSALLRAA